MNEEAYRIFALTVRSRATSAGRSPTSCRRGPTSSGVLASAFELSTLPNRAELRLKDLDRVIGYTLVAGAGRRRRDRSAR